MKKSFFLFVLFCSLICADSVTDLKNRVLHDIHYLNGWCSEERASCFMDLVLQAKPKVYVEIGVYGGRSLFPVASVLQYLNSGIAVGIGPWDRDIFIRKLDPVKDQIHVDWWNNLDLMLVYQSFLNTLLRHQLEDFCVMLKTTSRKAASIIGAIDILYLNASHSEDCLQDIELYLPKVRQGGYIWLSDALREEVQLTIDFIFNECDCIKLIEEGNCILFKKR